MLPANSPRLTFTVGRRAEIITGEKCNLWEEKRERVLRIERDLIASPAEIRVIHFLERSSAADGFSRFRGDSSGGTSCLG